MLSWDEPTASPNTPSPGAGPMARPVPRTAMQEVAASRSSVDATARPPLAETPPADTGERVRVVSVEGSFVKVAKA